MPYEITGRCPKCSAEDTFLIGNWPAHLGVYICPTCRALLNVPLDTGRCPGCGYEPGVHEFYDYAYAIPYLGGQFLGEPEPGPTCPRCHEGQLHFENVAHLNMGCLGTRQDGGQPWRGKDYLEKAIFVYALMAVSAEFELDPTVILDYFHVDVPISLIMRRRISFPILLDIRTHLLTIASLDEAPFPVTPKLRATAEQECGGLARLFKEGAERPAGKRWWELWKRKA